MTAIRIKDFPRVRQTFNYDCGASALQAILVHYGIEVRLEQLIQELDTSKDYGTSIKALVKTIQKYGLRVESRPMTITEVKSFIEREHPVILNLQAWKEGPVDWAQEWGSGHYAVAIGYTSEAILFEDPSAFTQVYLTYPELEERWHDIDPRNGERHEHHGIAVIGEPRFDGSQIRHMEAYVYDRRRTP